MSVLEGLAIVLVVLGVSYGTFLAHRYLQLYPAQADGVVLDSIAMLLVRASVGFTFFHLFFWFRHQDAGLVWFGLSLGSVGGNFNINLRLTAMEQQGTVRIISAPKVTVLNNVAAHMGQGIRVPVQTTSAQGTQTWRLYTVTNAGLMLGMQAVPGDLLMTLTTPDNKPLYYRMLRRVPRVQP